MPLSVVYVTASTIRPVGDYYFAKCKINSRSNEIDQLCTDDKGISMNQFNPLRVLVAEDEESFLIVLTTVLGSTKRFSVYPCEDGEQAVEALKTARFDLVILDYKLPGISGLNVLQWMHEQKMDIPVIMLTGAGSENIAVEVMKLGAYDYIRKDSFDRHHFPVIVNGVYERYLFRKDKEQREARARKLERDIAAFELLSNSLSSFAEDVNATLTTVVQLTDEGEQTLNPLLPPQGKEHLKTYLKKIREEYATLIAVGQSIVSLSKVVNENYLRMQNMHQSEVEMISSMKTSSEKTPQTS